VVTHSDPTRRPRREILLTRGGVVGHANVAASTASVSIGPGDMLVLASDGVQPGFLDHLPPSDVPARLARNILETHRKTDDDALVLVVRFRSSAP